MSSKSKKIVYKRNKKLGKIYHPDSGLVVKSAKEKIVIGRIDGNKFVPLDDTALDLCDEWNLKYDESLIDFEDADDSSEDEAEKSPKKKSQKSADEESDDEEKVPSRKASTKKSNTPVQPPADFAALIARQNKELQDFVAGVTGNGDNDERVAELEKELADTKKELTETKKKLKGVLAAMQGTL